MKTFVAPALVGARARERLCVSALLVSVWACAGGGPAPEPLQPARGDASASGGAAGSAGVQLGSDAAAGGAEQHFGGGAGGRGEPPTDAGASGGDAAAGEGPTGPGEGDVGATQPGPCCEASKAKGCNDSAVAQCVCAKDPRCCEEAWDEVCVALVAGVSGADCGSCAVDCCSESSAPGCTDSKVQECVCALDDTCCRERWDASCVFLVSKELDGAKCGVCQ